MTKLQARNAPAKEWFIYSLCDPITNEVRYIGVSTNPQRRLRQHFNYGRKIDSRMATSEWIYNLRQEGLRPILNILHKFEASRKFEHISVENLWIGRYRNKGCNLLNRPVFRPTRENIRHLLANANVRPAVVSTNIPKEKETA